MQKHPQFDTDRDRIDALLGHDGSPGNLQLTTAAMLLNRHLGMPGSEELTNDIQKCLQSWGINRDQLNAKCRTIWQSGWKPGQLDLETGSGGDVNASDQA